MGRVMGDVIPFRPRPQTETRLDFGSCPECGQSDGFMKIGGEHFYFCEAHNTAWYGEDADRPIWMYDPQELNEDNERKLRSMRIVAPIYPEGAA